MGLYGRKVIYYLSIPSGSCYCRPMICALVPFSTCSLPTHPAALSLASSYHAKAASDQTSISKAPVLREPSERSNRRNGFRKCRRKPRQLRGFGDQKP